MRVIRYDPSWQPRWDEFVHTSKNGTFMLLRGYMDYHADRFEDHSLLFIDDHDRVLALLPANRRGAGLHSHAGLTYGGLILDRRTGTPEVLTLFEVLLDYCRDSALAELHYKTVPSIYHQLPAEEDRYALFRHRAELTRRDVLSVIPASGGADYQQRRRRAVRSARKTGISVAPSGDLAGFWGLLGKVLDERHGVSPVHTLAEIERLQRSFPSHIRLFLAHRDGELLAGTLVYQTATVAHLQYIASSAEGRQLHALDLLIDELVGRYATAGLQVDFGISNEQGGRVLNQGLIEQKEGFGARAIVHDHYLLRVI